MEYAFNEYANIIKAKQVNKYFLNLYIKKIFINYPFIFLILILSSCQTPKYLQVKNFTKSDSILPEVKYLINENFDPEEINCIAIGKIEDKSDKNEFPKLDKVNLAKYSLYGHLSPKKYRDVEIHQMTYFLKLKKNINLVLKTLNCDAILEGEILKFENKFYVAFSSTQVGLYLSLKKRNGELLWQGNHIASSRAGTIPLSPISLATGIFSASTNTEEEVALQMLDAAVRRLVKTIPDRKTINNKLQLKYMNVPIDKKIIPIKNKNIINPNILFSLGEYNKAIDLIDEKLKINATNHELIFLKGRSYLMLNQYKKASSSFLDSIAIKPKDIYFNGLGFVYTKLGDYDKSVAAYQKAISLNNKNNFAYFNSGLIFEKQGFFRKAGKYFYSAGTSSILNKDFTNANDSLVALQRITKKQKELTKKLIKLKKLIHEFTTLSDEKIKIVKIKN